MTKAANRNQFILRLDPRIALEAIILNRLEQTPRGRKQEWLRGMLVQGFRLECQVLREAPDTTRSRSTMSFSDWKSKDTPRQVSMRRPGPIPGSMPKQMQVVKEAPPITSTDRKPFAALGKVIG